MKNLKISYLLDFYGKLFSEKQQEILEMYFQDDMSLSEIAEVTGITRQGVYDNIKRCEKEILSLENKLNLMDRFIEMSSFLDMVEGKLDGRDLSSGDIDELKISVSKIRNLI